VTLALVASGPAFLPQVRSFSGTPNGSADPDACLLDHGRTSMWHGPGGHSSCLQPGFRSPGRIRRLGSSRVGARQRVGL